MGETLISAIFPGAPISFWSSQKEAEDPYSGIGFGGRYKYPKFRISKYQYFGYQNCYWMDICRSSPKIY